MRDRKLLEITVVTDDETGIYQIGELEYGVPVETCDWLEARPENRTRLAAWLRQLAARCECREPPFGPPVGDVLRQG